MANQPVLIGQRLRTYEIQSLIGSGGMAFVYRGFDHNLQRPVAIKVLSSTATAQPDLAERFRQEARLIARLRHPHIVQVYDFGEQDGITYMIEELLPGPTLGRHLRELTAQGAQLTRDEVLTIVKQLASALDSAHTAGIIHRDVKPENALYNAQGDLVLTDFGIARQMFSDVKHTQTGMIIGTPHYFSPEQAQGRPLTPASDIYALGVVLYELLTGSVPFSGDTPMGVLMDHIQKLPPLVLERRPDLTPPVDQVVQRALAKDPTARFSKASELARTLEQAWPPSAAQITPPADVHHLETQVWGGGPQTPQTPRPMRQSDLPPTPTASPRSAPPAPTPARHPPPEVGRAGGSNKKLPVTLIIVAVLLLLSLCGGVLAVVGLVGITPNVATVDPTPTTAVTPTTEIVVEPTATVEPTITPTPEPTATQGPPPPSGQMVFSSQRDGDWDIYLMSVDGSNVRNLTDSNADDFSPVWSPNGQLVAFHSNRDGDEDIYIMNADGRNIRNLTDNQDLDDREPTWSPDGRSLAFWSRPLGTWDIFVINVDGSDRRQLTDDLADDFAPAWSPDGRFIAFTTNREGAGNDEIYLMNADGSNVRNLTNTPGANDKLPAWSPDGGRIVFMSERDGNAEIYVMNADGSEQRNIINDPPQPGSPVDTYPIWSPDGRFIAFTSNRDGNDEIYVMDVDGSNPRRITEQPGGDWDAAWTP